MDIKELYIFQEINCETSPDKHWMKTKQMSIKTEWNNTGQKKPNVESVAQLKRRH